MIRILEYIIQGSERSEEKSKAQAAKEEKG
jgi:hypothetical protein